MNGSKIAIFISSTCYDLAQIRHDILIYADSCEYEPILSERNDFAIDPSINAIDNCFNNIRSKADVFVLIIGNRYGSIHKNGKSITRLEYHEASAKGIPIYVFINREIDAIYQSNSWKKDSETLEPLAEVDTNVLEFINEIYESGNKWVFKFEYAQDIISTLKIQLSYLFSSSLDARRKLTNCDKIALGLEPASLRLYTEKPKGWEYLLFGELLREKCEKIRLKKFDLDLGIGMGAPIVIQTNEELKNWIYGKMNKPQHLFGILGKMINHGILMALGEPGKPANIERLIHVTSRISEVYQMIIDWTIEFNQVMAEEHHKKALELAASLTTKAIVEIETWAFTAYEKIECALNSNEEKVHLDLTLNLSAPENIEPLIYELKNLE